MGTYVGLQFKAVIPEPSWCPSCKHLTPGTFLQFLDFPLIGILPERVRLSLLQLTVGNYKLATKLAQGLLL